MLSAKQESLQDNMRREIASLLDNGKVESARIKVEHIIRQDYNREAMEMLELFCELLLARIPLLTEQKTCDSSLLEAVNTIIYAASRSEVKELISVRDMLAKKFGKEFTESALNNRHGLVNPRVQHRLHVTVPDPDIVTAYLQEIADKFKVSFTPPEKKTSGGTSGDPGNGGQREMASGPPVAHYQAMPVAAIPIAIQNGSLPAPAYQAHSTSDTTVLPPSSLSDIKSSSAAEMSSSNLSIPKLPGSEDSEEWVMPSAPEALPDEPDFDLLAKRFEELKKKK